MADALSDLRYISRMGYRDPWAEATKSISDSLLAYGISSFLTDTTMKRSDGYNVQVNEKTGLIDYSNTDGSNCKISIPYSMKLLIQELQAMSIYTRLEIDTPISNKPVFKYLLQNLMNS